MGVAACGGSNQPPLMPDSVEPSENPEAGTAPTGSGSPKPPK